MDTEFTPFTTYKEVEVHELKLRLRSETQKLRFENHWRALGDKKVRSTLFSGAVKEAVSDMKPVQHMADLMTTGGVTSQLVMGMLTRRGGLMKRLLGSVAAVVLPNLMAKVPWGKLAGQVATKWNGDEASAQNGHGH